MAAGPEATSGRTIDVLRRQLAAAVAERDEAQAQQAATAEVLRVISQSPTDVQPVLDAVAAAACRFCGADDVVIGLREGDELLIAAHEGPLDAPTARRKLDRTSSQGRAIIDGRTVHNPDFARLDPQEWAKAIALSREFGFKAALAVPMMRDGVAIGTIMLRRPEAGPFAPRQIELAETFAAQAVIALENTRLFTELRESLDQQTATTEVLQTINSSQGDLQPVFDAIVDKAMTLCDAAFGLFNTFDGDRFRTVATRGIPEVYAEFRRTNPPDYSPDTGPGRLLVGEDVAHIADTANSEPYKRGDLNRRALVDLGGARTIANVALRKEGKLLGMIAIYRQEVRPFSDKEIFLLQSFAAQAVIAMENARLLTELRDSLDQQTATSEVLRVISQSPTDVQPALEAVAAAARRFCGAVDASITLRDGEELVVAAHDGSVVGGGPGQRDRFDRTTSRGRSIDEGRTIHIPDLEAAEGEQFELARRIGRQFNFRAVISTPLLRDVRAIGCLTLRKPEPGAFTPHQIALLETFAAQAVIAIENVRLFTELRESLEQQTATAEILRVISRSPEDVQPVLDAVAAAAVRFCGAVDAAITLREGNETIIVAHTGPLAVSRRRSLLDKNYVRGRAILEGRTIHVPDLFATEEFPDGREQAREWGHRAVASAPLLREGEAIGCLSLQKPEPTPFTDRQLQLLEAFAAQAVIAIENTRLFAELRQRTDDLTQSLEYQTATSELLEVISRSTSDIQPVLETILASARQLCDVHQGSVVILQDSAFRFRAFLGISDAMRKVLEPMEVKPGLETLAGRTLLKCDVVRIEDVRADPDYAGPGVVLEEGRTGLGVPLLRAGQPIGAIILTRNRVEPFSERQVTLIKTFADQAVIAMENARLLSELRERTDDLTESLEYQTATSEVLEVIGRSTSDIQPVLDTMLSAALHLCRTESGGIAIQQGDGFRYVATLGWDPEADRAFRSLDITAGRGTVAARVLAEGRIVQVADVASDPEFALPDMAERAQWHTALGVPLMRDDRPIGVIAITRDRVEPFTERQIALIKTFADQAVIAMENARLLGELRESLDQQTATTEVLAVINSSPGDLTPVFESMLEKAHALCRVEYGSLQLYDGTMFRAVAVHNLPEALEARLREGYAPGPAFQRLIEGADFDHTPDMAEVDEPMARTVVDAGIRTLLRVALRKDGKLLGQIVAARKEVQPFADKEIALLRSFASQGVIAMENARLLGELRQRTDDLTESLEYQTATSDVLSVISRSPATLQPVLEAMTAAAVRLCGVKTGGLSVRRGDRLEFVALVGQTPVFERWQMSAPIPIERGIPLGDAILDKAPVQIVDVMETEAYRARAVVERAVVDLGRHRTVLHVPLLREDEAIGVLTVSRGEPLAFTERQIGLIKTFADQAVIAMENARLLSELRARTDDLTESLEYQTAISELLEVISRSTSELQPVLDALLAAATRLCGTSSGTIAIRQGDTFRRTALIGFSPEVAASLRGQQVNLGEASLTGRALAAGQVVQVADLANDPDYEINQVVPLGNFRSSLGVPLLREGETIGAIVLGRDRVEPFTERQIGLIKTFADQAVIAMENARLLGELRESLEQQTATSDVLRTISRSSIDLGGVLDALVQTVARLCHADQAYMFRRRDELHHLVASHGLPDEAIDYLNNHPFEPDEGTISGRVVLHGRTVHIRDVLQDEQYTYGGGQKTAGFRTMLGIPLMAQDKMVGVFVVTRTHVEPFSEKEIALATGFADQAVIAIENARLFEELRDRQAELRVTFDNMGDGVVMFGADLKLASWNRNFQELLDIPDSFLASRPDVRDYVRLLVTRGEMGNVNLEKEVARYVERVTRQWSVERTRPDGRVLQVRNNPVPGGGAVLIYSDITKRKQAEAEIAAARDAAEAALERQTATADILKVIASSPTDVQPVLDAVAKAAVRFCGAPDAIVALRQGDEEVAVAHEGILTASLGMSRPLTGGLLGGLSIVEGRTLQIADIDAPDAVVGPALLALAKQHKWRASAAAPMLRDGKAIGSVVLRKPEPGPFSPQQIKLLETFAAQAVIAIENVRLFTELRDSLERLRAAQANLIQSEKMASLGQLTAGIAHEIKNPLNFVNNFASLSVELLDELKEVAGPALASLDEDKRAELDETMSLLIGNLAKITEHGKRADGIVKSMLSHSRGGAGDWQPSDINSLVEEALNLAYHGARAQDKEFNVTLERDFEKTGKPIDVVPQDVTRVFLNLFGNGFYAANKRRLGAREPGFRPTIKVATRDLGDRVEVRVRDNGIGIPPEAREKLFQPFFTTKPTGEGTGLGLSISYDIVTQQHGGTIEVESEPGQFTEFTVRLPRSRRPSPTIEASERA